MGLSDDELINILSSRLAKAREDRLDSQSEIFKTVEDLGEQLKRSEQLKTNFLSNIRNEINNPLSSVLGLSKFLMQADGLEPETIQRKAFLIHNEAFNLDFQMRNIFAAAEIEAGKLLPEMVMVDITRLIYDVIDSFQFKIDQKNLSFSQVMEVMPLCIVTDSYMMYIVISNLISNAIEYSKPHGVIKVEAFFKSGVFKMSIKDEGKGVKKEEESKIFQRFYQLDYGIKKEHSGHGLGLSITKEITEILGGTLSLTDSSNLGSTFTVSIPCQIKQNANKMDKWDESMFGNDQIF